jgi:hypothetical protein
MSYASTMQKTTNELAQEQTDLAADRTQWSADRNRYRAAGMIMDSAQLLPNSFLSKSRMKQQETV